MKSAYRNGEIKLKEPQIFMLNQDYNRFFKKGHPVKIDRIKYSADSWSCLSVRVINLTKRPLWFDSGWIE